MKISKEVKVGLLALVSGSMLYLGFNFLKGIDFFSNAIVYYAVYSKVDGLTVSNPVTLNGFVIGRVKSIDLLPKQKNKLLVTLEIEEDVQLGYSTVAVLDNTDLIGAKSIVLHMGNDSKKYTPGDTLRSEIEKNITEILAEEAVPVVGHLDSTILRINSIFDTRLKGNISNMMSNLEATSLMLKRIAAENQANLVGITGNLNQLSSSLVETEKNLKPLLSNLNTVSDSLKAMQLNKTINDLDKTINDINKLVAGINEGKGTVGKLIKDDSLYVNLNRSSADLDKLLVDFKEHPGRYIHFSVFGRKEK
ncbi:MAG: MlaD family protein [Cytophagales bacterium]|nr:MlaD family protein [Cytophagales bacterium]